MKINSATSMEVNKNLKGMKVLNDSTEAKDVFTPSTSGTEEVNLKKPSTKKYKPNYVYLNVASSCGNQVNTMLWVEQMNIKDVYAIRDQYGIPVTGIGKETIPEYKTSKIITGVPSDYQYGRIYPGSCGDTVLVAWDRGQTMSYEEAKKMAKENGIELKFHANHSGGIIY